MMRVLELYLQEAPHARAWFPKSWFLGFMQHSWVTCFHTSNLSVAILAQNFDLFMDVASSQRSDTRCLGFGLEAFHHLSKLVEV